MLLCVARGFGGPMRKNTNSRIALFVFIIVIALAILPQTRAKRPTVVGGPSDQAAQILRGHRDAPRSIAFRPEKNSTGGSSLVPALLTAPSLSAPSNGAGGVSTTPPFSWSSVSGANRYWLTVATSASTLPTDPTATSCSACIISGNTDSTSYTTPNAFPFAYH